jgi:hypothetical protein
VLYPRADDECTPWHASGGVIDAYVTLEGRLRTAKVFAVTGVVTIVHRYGYTFPQGCVGVRALGGAAGCHRRAPCRLAGTS